MNYTKNKSIVCYDGVCNLCHSTVNFIIKNDPKERFVFASLQSDAAIEILLQHNGEKVSNDTIVLVEDGDVYEKSTAALRIIKRLHHPIRMLYPFIVLPKWVRDPIYNYIAKNRYKWYGKKEKCMVPNSILKNRFLELF